MRFDILSPDTARYNIQIKKDSSGTVNIFADYGTFNYTDEPEISFYVKPHSHPFIIDNSLWNVAYLKPVFDRHVTVLPGKTEKVITFKYLNKYNKYFKNSFTETSTAHSTHGILHFEIKGAFLPKDILFNKCSGYHEAAIQGKELSDTLSITNKGSQALLIDKVICDEGMLVMNENAKKISIPAGKKGILIFRYTPIAKGSFSKAASISFVRTAGKPYTALYKIRGIAK